MNLRKKIFLAGILLFFILLFSISNMYATDELTEQTWDISASENDNVTATLKGDTLTISGTGKMKNYAYGEDTEWFTLVGNEGINKIIIERGVTNIGDYMARGLWTVTLVEIPETVTRIGNEAFVGCYDLESITIPESVLFIGEGAFAYSGLKSIEIPYNVITVGCVAFSECPLTDAKILNGDTILLGEKIDLGPFELLDVTVEQPERKTTVKTLPTKTEYKYGEEIKLDGGIVQIKVEGEETKEISMTDPNIEYIVEDYNSAYGTLDVVLIYTEGNNKYFTYYTIDVYDYIVELSVSNLPKTQYKYGEALNLANGKIKYVTYLENTKEISMTDDKVEVTGYDATKLGKQTLTVEYTPNKETYTTTFDVEVSEADKYDISKNNDGLIMATLVGNTLSISGNGEMCNFTEYERPLWEDDNELIENIIIGQGVTNIGDCVFLDCTNLKSVTIPESVTQIGYGAFAYCKSIKTINIPENVTSIGYSAFYYCEALENINIPKNITIIEDGLFYECSSLVNIEIPEKVTSIGNKAFYGCSNLININLPDSLEEIGEYAFFLCKITSIDLSENLQKIGEAAFRSCNIAQVTIPASVREIGHSAFACCMNLKNIEVESENKNYLSENGVLFDINKTKLIQYNIASERTIYTIPKGVKIIGESSFNGAKNIEKLEVPSSITEVLGKYSVAGGGPAIYAFENYMSEVFYDGSEHELRNIKYDFSDSISDLIGLHAWDNVHYNSIIDAEKSSIEASYEYTGSEIKPCITLETWKGKLVEGTDYKINYENNINVGKATISIIGMGNYEGQEVQKTFEITAKDISSIDISGIEDKEYTGQVLTQNLVLTMNDIKLKEGIDYSVYYKNTTKAGIATITITGIGNFKGTITKTFEIKPLSIETMDVKDINNQIFTGKEIKPQVEIKNGNVSLEKGTDFDIIYKNNIDIGTATVIITGKGNYTGTITKTFKILAKDISTANISGIDSKYYNGQPLTLDIIVTMDYIELNEGIDYSIEYRNNTNAGIATIIITGKGNYTGELKKAFKIEKELVEEHISIEGIKDLTYTGNKQTLNIVVKDGSNVLKEGIDYTLEYLDNMINAGPKEVILKGKGYYYGGITKHFRINPYKLSRSTISGIENKQYTEKNIKQTPTIKNGKVTLKEGKDYYIQYIDNKDLGKATMRIVFIGNYDGETTKTFIIKPKKVTGLKVKEQKTDSIKLSWSKHTGVTGYKVYSYNYSKNKWEYVGKTKETSYTIKKLKAGTTYKFRVRAYKTIDGKQYYGSYTSGLKTTTKTKKPSISKLSTKSKKATIKWKKISGASGYQIYMATSKNGKYSKIKTITKGSTTSYTKTKLKKNKKYYFKIRTYRTVDGKKVYSSYSSVKSIKIK